MEGQRCQFRLGTTTLESLSHTALLSSMHGLAVTVLPGWWSQGYNQWLASCWQKMPVSLPSSPLAESMYAKTPCPHCSNAWAAHLLPPGAGGPQPESQTSPMDLFFLILTMWSAWTFFIIPVSYLWNQETSHLIFQISGFPQSITRTSNTHLAFTPDMVHLRTESWLSHWEEACATSSPWSPHSLVCP